MAATTPMRNPQDGNPMDPRVINWSHSEGSIIVDGDFLDRTHPRIPITPTMLKAYALMQGPASNKLSTHGDLWDPVYFALFNSPQRDYSSQLKIPRIGRKESMESLNKAVKFYWDPQYMMVPEELLQNWALQYHDENETGPFRHRESTEALNYKEYLREYPPSVGANHTKGDMVYANFGWIQLGEHWIDTDCAEEIYEALRIVDGKPADTFHLPGIPNRVNIQPRVLNSDEQDLVYREFMQYVSKDMDIYGNVIDQEGDPRDYRISPETFLRWATGAAIGERYEEKLFEQPTHPFLRKERNPNKLRTSYRNKPYEPQYDIWSGCRMSDIFSVTEEPSLLMSAPGIEPTDVPPVHFSYSYPQFYNLFLRTAYVAKWVGDQRSGGILTSVASLPETYTTQLCAKYLAILGDSENGMNQFHALEAVLQETRRDREKAFLEAKEICDETMAAKREKERIEREVFYLQRRADQLSILVSEYTGIDLKISTPILNGTELTTRSNLHNASPGTPSEHTIGEDSSMLTEYEPSPARVKSPWASAQLGLAFEFEPAPSYVGKLSRGEKKFLRHLEDQFNDENITIRMTMAQQKDAGLKKEKIEKDRKYWDKKKAILLRSFRVNTIEELPDLMPLGKTRRVQE